jgi:hypothetical protein
MSTQQRRTTRRRKSRIKKEDASMIAIRVATEHGADVGLAAEVRDVLGDDWWPVFVRDRVSGADPGGVLVRVHKQTGEAEMEMSL